MEKLSTVAVRIHRKYGEYWLKEVLVNYHLPWLLSNPFLPSPSLMCTSGCKRGKWERGGGGGKIKWKLSEANTRAVSRGQNELIGKLKMAVNVRVLLNLPPNTDQITCCHL